MSLTLTTTSPAETLALGRRLAALLTAGDIVLLSGRLGAGKTLFVSGVAEGLGIEERVTSPTFVISRIYRGGFLTLVHADVYRLGSLAEFEDLELPDDGLDGVVVVEWGEAISKSIGDDHLSIDIAIDGDNRIFTFRQCGSWAIRSLEVLT